MKFVKHDETGRILFCGECIDSHFDLQGDCTVAGEADMMLDYVIDGAIVRRPRSPIVLMGQTHLLRVPPGSMLHINEQPYAIGEDDRCEMSFTYPGTYQIRVECWPYLDFASQVVIP